MAIEKYLLRRNGQERAFPLYEIEAEYGVVVVVAHAETQMKSLEATDVYERREDDMLLAYHGCILSGQGEDYVDELGGDVPEGVESRALGPESGVETRLVPRSEVGDDVVRDAFESGMTVDMLAEKYDLGIAQNQVFDRSSEQIKEPGALFGDVQSL